MRRFLRMGAAVATLCCTGGVSAQTGPVPIDPLTWVTHDDYPAEALNANESGLVVLSMDVDAKGAITGCTVTQSSGSASLDATSCRVIRERGRFTPATDARGQPVVSSFQRRISWGSPTTEMSRLLPFAVVTQVKLGKEGVILDCKTRDSSMDGDRVHACLQKDGKYTGFVDMNLADFGPGILTISSAFEVDGIRLIPNPAAGVPGDILPYFTQSDTLTVDATGKVVACERRSSKRDDAEPCSFPVTYEPKPDQPARHATMTYSMAFQPAK